MRKLMLVAGARPNFMKIAPIIRALAAASQLPRVDPPSWRIVHTGQHYDHEMSRAFFDDLDIPSPDYFLGVGSASHAAQTAQIMMAFEGVCLKETPDVVVVVGDVNSTVACALVAKKLGIGVAHVEAGLRSRDLTMPEEINRMVTDVLSDWLFVSEQSGVENLRAEGKRESSIHLVGNVMVDNLHYEIARMDRDQGGSGRPEGPYAVLTLHRPSNVDPEDKLREIMGAVEEIGKGLPVRFPAHPRTRGRLHATGLLTALDPEAVRVMPPLPYRAFLRLFRDAALVLTDSGGIQEETTALGIPCFTIRENTERPVTIDEGTNTLVGTSRDGILKAFQDFQGGRAKRGRIPPLWDGRTAQRIVEILFA